MKSTSIHRLNSTYPSNRLPITGAGVLTGLFCLCITASVWSQPSDTSKAREEKMVASFETAMTDGDQTRALKHVMDYSEQVNGEFAPETIRLMHRYGYALYKDGRYREAIDVLKQTLERSGETHGEFGGEAFEINMNLARAYSKRRTRWGPRLEYFDRALEVLRERGEHESITYVATLAHIVINLLNSDSLSGHTSPDFNNAMESYEPSEIDVVTEVEYRSNFGKPERYLQEAVEISARLEHEDEYISAKIAVLQAKLKVMETADLAAVSGGVDGSITKSTERKYYDREEARLASAIEYLARDVEANQAYLDAANNILLEIAWHDKDEARLMAMCANGVINSAGDYPPDRLYEIMEGGTVFAPEVGVRVSTNIFKQLRTIRRQQKDERGNPVKRPYFKPVCIDGQLMAALMHAPRVTVEEIR